jgi:hypothetical protein
MNISKLWKAADKNKAKEPEPPKETRQVYIGITSGFMNSDVQHVSAVGALAAQKPMPLMIGWNCDPSIIRARNELAAEFLLSTCTHLLYIDSDIIFKPGDVDRITSHKELVVGGLYPLKRDLRVVEWCVNTALVNGDILDGRKVDLKPRDDGLQAVRYVGTGFMCIARAAFEKILEHDREEIEYQSDREPHRTEHAFFREGVHKTVDHWKRFLTEDYFFCQRWIELGETVWADTQCPVRHAGRAVWPLPQQINHPWENKS